MKKLLIIALALVGLNATAQNKDKKGKEKIERHEKMKDVTPEEMAQIQTKKMTLHLDLTDAQQKQIQSINLANAQERKAKMAERMKAKEGEKREKPSKEERLKRTNERLDRAIAQKKQMKSILNQEQYAKWEKSIEKRGKKRRHQGKKRKDKSEK